jgi:translation initiation factor 1
VRAKLVYSTAIGSVCPGCGRPARDCICSSRQTADVPIPARIVAKLRMEKKGRGGKTVTVVYDLPRNTAFLNELAQDLKRACGTGGAVVDATIELQGDLRERVRARLEQRGYIIKG